MEDDNELYIYLNNSYKLEGWFGKCLKVYSAVRVVQTYSVHPTDVTGWHDSSVVACLPKD